MLSLIVDTRERAVIPFIEEEIKNYEYEVKQINTSDFLICKKEENSLKILASIERKTHNDFAASFKDGRYNNLNKMLDLRKTTNCQLYFILEGNAFPSPNRKFSRIPFSNILSAVTKMMVKHGIFIIQTENEAHSAKRISDLIKTYDTVDDLYVAQENKEICGIECSDITNRIEPREDETIINVWSKLNGISIVSAKMLSKEFSIKELAIQEVKLEKINNLKTLTGRPLNKNAINSLMSIYSNNIDNSVKLLSGIPNISCQTIKQVLTHTNGLHQLCLLPPNDISEISIKQINRTVKFGSAKTTKLLSMINYKKQ